MVDSFTEAVIGAAFEVHNVLGFGYSEKVYERALTVELEIRGVKFKTRQGNRRLLQYKGGPAGSFNRRLGRCRVEDRHGSAPGSW